MTLFAPFFCKGGGGGSTSSNSSRTNEFVKTEYCGRVTLDIQKIYHQQNSLYKRQHKRTGKANLGWYATFCKYIRQPF